VHRFIQILFILFSFTGIVVGLLMVFVPARYPALYAGFLRESVMKRQRTETDKARAIRAQGFVLLAIGALLALFVWAL
jgi:ABC-type transport system involved in cytochrome c biogenesis permease subunit